MPDGFNAELAEMITQWVLHSPYDPGENLIYQIDHAQAGWILAMEELLGMLAPGTAARSHWQSIYLGECSRYEVTPAEWLLD